MEKLRYMARIARELSNVDPVRRRGETDITVDEMESTVGEFYQRTRAQSNDFATQAPYSGGRE